MTQDISTALNLLGVGMITVFIVLTLVVAIGNLLIRFVNQLPQPTPPITQSKASSGKADPKTIAVLTAVVDHVTHGKGSIHHIEKIS